MQICIRIGAPDLGIKPKDIPLPLVEAKRAHLLLRRKIKADPNLRSRVCRNCGKQYEKKKGRKPGDGNSYCSRECAYADVRSWHSTAGEFKPIRC